MEILGNNHTLDFILNKVENKMGITSDIKNIITMYYYISEKTFNLNPIIPICNFINNINTHGIDMLINKCNPGCINDSSTNIGDLKSFDTTIEGVKAHIDIIGRYLNLDNDKLLSNKYLQYIYPHTSSSSIGLFEEFCNNTIAGGKLIEIEITNDDLYIARDIYDLYAKGIISDLTYWQRVLLTKDTAISKANVISLIRKL